jgi:hypothetical protein
MHRTQTMPDATAVALPPSPIALVRKSGTDGPGLRPRGGHKTPFPPYQLMNKKKKKNGPNKHNLGRKMGFFSYNSKHCNVFYLVATPWVRRKSRNWHCDLSVQGDWGCHF